jgi:6-oxo-cyclohex-1-ene-carbonyl-CoA hydrolase
MAEDHRLFSSRPHEHVRYEERPARDERGELVQGLHNVWITLDNEKQLNAYTNDAIRGVIAAFDRASNDRRCVAIVLTGAGDKAFCTGGNTAELATLYARRPLEFRQHLKLFGQMITAVLRADKPVINRVNGLRIAGGQELGLACDFSITADTARFGQAGVKHGSAPDGGSTDLLDLYVGIGRALESCALCEPWSAHMALRLNLVNELVPVLRKGDRFVANPLVETQRMTDECGRLVYGEWKTGAAAAAARAELKECTTDLSPLDAAVERWCAKLLATFPDCLMKTIESLRKKKLARWELERDTNRAWLAGNMMTEARAGFRAFHYGPKEQRHIDYAELRRRLAEGLPWDDAMFTAIWPAGVPLEDER